jgi:dihydrofolate synthase/folylpolyglutamate synthase
VLSFTSPHLVSVKERVRFNGSLLDDEVWQAGFAAMTEGLQQEPAIKLTYFESVFVFFLWVSQELQADVNLVEAGLGGMWDATNVLEDTLAVLTLVDYDHTEILGNTLTEIATDKSGIIKPGATVIVGKQPDEALTVYQARIAEQKARATLSGTDFGWTTEDEEHFLYRDRAGEIESLSLSVPGTHQWDNASTAICTARLLFPDLAPQDIRERLEHCSVPGRQQLLKGNPDVLVDVAHNPVSFRALAKTLRERYANRKILAVIGMMKEKDARNSLEALRGVVKDVFIVQLANPRSAKQEDLRGIALSLGFRVECPPSLDVAFETLHSNSQHDLGLVAGSFYLAGDYLKWRSRAGIA